MAGLLSRSASELLPLPDAAEGDEARWLFALLPAEELLLLRLLPFIDPEIEGLKWYFRMEPSAARSRTCPPASPPASRMSTACAKQSLGQEAEAPQSKIDTGKKLDVSNVFFPVACSVCKTVWGMAFCLHKYVPMKHTWGWQ